MYRMIRTIHRYDMIHTIHIYVLDDSWALTIHHYDTKLFVHDMIRIIHMIRIAYRTILTTMTQSINFTQNKQPNLLKDFNKKIHFKPTYLCIVWYVRFTDMIWFIRYASMYQTIYEHLRYALIIRNFLYTILTTMVIIV